ncbi:MAG: SDR family NAD(P)-dependent oxidoreductase [Cytophagales bacterium]|nr:SDR family NAD(P)-dependent oxidoreductase [Cytophagales bacterium]
MDLENNTILITGGSSGIGFELARRLARNNKVLICGRSESKLERAEKHVRGLETFQCDLSKGADCDRLGDWIENRFPDLNILVNNAALVHTDSFLEGTDLMDKAILEFNTNTLAPIRLAHKLLPLLLKNSDPGIINVTTGLAYTPRAAYPFYSATKAALHSFTQVLRYQLRHNDIKVIEAVFPAVDTPWHKGNAPKIAIPAGKAVDEMIHGIRRDKDEIRIGKVKLIYLISRMAPKFAFKKINSLN